MPNKASEFVETHNNLQFQLCLRLLFWVSSKRNIIENKLTKMLIIKYEFMKLTTEKFNYDNVLLSVDYHIATYLIKHLKRCIQSNLEIPSKFTSFTGNILVNEWKLRHSSILQLHYCWGKCISLSKRWR